jgi:hypothetical protein
MVENKRFIEDKKPKASGPEATDQVTYPDLMNAGNNRGQLIIGEGDTEEVVWTNTDGEGHAMIKVRKQMAEEAIVARLKAAWDALTPEEQDEHQRKVRAEMGLPEKSI